MATSPANPAEITPVGTACAAPAWLDDELALVELAAAPDALAPVVDALLVTPAPAAPEPDADPDAPPVAATVLPLLARVDATVPLMYTVPLRVTLGPTMSVPLLDVPLAAPVVMGKGAAVVMLVGEAVPLGAMVTPAAVVVAAAAAGMR